jgi:hypothetical protein
VSGLRSPGCVIVLTLTGPVPVRRITNDRPPEQVTSLSLCLGKESNGKIKVSSVLHQKQQRAHVPRPPAQYIEALDRYVHLLRLDLSQNMIERIANLGALVRLEHLDLSYNRLTRIEGLEKLVRLQVCATRA